MMTNNVIGAQARDSQPGGLKLPPPAHSGRRRRHIADAAPPGRQSWPTRRLTEGLTSYECRPSASADCSIRDGAAISPTVRTPLLKASGSSNGRPPPVAPFDGRRSSWQTIASIASTVPSGLALRRPSATSQTRRANSQPASRRGRRGPRARYRLPCGRAETCQRPRGKAPPPVSDYRVQDRQACSAAVPVASCQVHTHARGDPPAHRTPADSLPEATIRSVDNEAEKDARQFWVWPIPKGQDPSASQGNARSTDVTRCGGEAGSCSERPRGTRQERNGSISTSGIGRPSAWRRSISVHSWM
jgi:hypothetical protein